MEHYKTQDWEIFLVQELVKHGVFAHLTRSNAWLTKFFLV